VWPHRDCEAIKQILGTLNRSCTKISYEYMQNEIIPKFPQLIITIDSLRSLQTQLFTRMMKYEGRKSNEDGKLKEIQELVIHLKISYYEACCKIGYSSYKFAKTYLEKHCGSTNNVISSFIKEPYIVSDGYMRHELLTCISDDIFQSIESEKLKGCIGKEYEELLITLLSDKKMCFETEEDLRQKGKSKTPDILFLIPMIVTLQDHEYIVNWIDSKAMFADEDTYKDSLEQFNGYCNRYGKGLVIYWFGHVDTIVSSNDICVCDSFPLEWSFPTGDIADGRTPSFDYPPDV
jgi:hypothetical protein